MMDRFQGLVRRHPVKTFALSGAVISTAYRSRQKQMEMKKKRILVLPFYKMNIVEQTKPNLRSFSSSTTEMAVDELVGLIHEAAKDPNITGIHGIFGNGFGFSTGGWAHLEEIRNALTVFRQSHRDHPETSNSSADSIKTPRKLKPLVAYSNTFSSPLPKADMREYYLASAFSTIMLQSQGDLNLFGLSTSNMFYRDFLKRYGIQVDVFKHGLYKNFANQFTHKSYSKEHKENVKNLVTSINHMVCETIFNSREIFKKYDEYEAFWDMIHSSGSLPADAAKKIGLVDRVVGLDPIGNVISALKQAKSAEEEKTKGGIRTSDVINSWIAKNTGFEDFEVEGTVSIQEYAKESTIKKFQKFSFDTSNQEKIAVLKVTGAITDKTAERVNKALRKLKGADNVKALVLRVDSPGGAITACESIQQELRNTGKEYVVSFGNVSASGGYYISTHSNRIFALPTTITGSIGVFMLRMNFTGLAKQYGVTVDSVQSSDLSGSFDPFTPINNPMKRNFENFSDRAYMRFKSLVSDGRKMDMNAVEDVAQGKVWTGKQAQDIGLVDELGGLQKAIAYCQRSFTKDGNAEVVRWPPRMSFLEMLSGEDEDLKDTFPGALALMQSSAADLLGLEYGLQSRYKSQDFKIPSSVSGMMLTIDEDWAIRCMLENEEQVRDFMSNFPSSAWD
ncbi:unnamed protein product [Cylindrotheca closterium]|uniref:Peptidase S49 domain-containing protein n=1 Tax=Cylindrotheca closterium TaxID=2856 RepID=A0AAD2JIC0_9STRA|nr:unnamed protein product [Cylindrotheca closterium]